MIHQLRTRNFILCFLGADYYAFVHRTFLEYFCAWEFVWQFKETQTLSIEALKTEVFGKHWQDESWHEVLRLITGMIDPSFAGKVIDDLMAQDGEAEKFINLFLSAECLSEVRNRSVIAETATRLLNQLKGLTKYDLHDDYKPYEDEARLVGEIHTKSVAAVATTWKDDPDTLPWLKNCVLLDGYEYMRYIAVQELARGWKDDSDILLFLKSLAQSDKPWRVRQAAMQEIARGWKDAPDTLTFLKFLAQSDEHEYMRYTATWELSRGWKNDPNTLHWLQSHAQSGAWEVRQSALWELSRGWKNDPNTLHWLKTCALSDEDWRVRKAAVEELAREWKDEPWMFNFLWNLAVNDPFEGKEQGEHNPRQTALEAIIKNYPDESQTLQLLRDRAENDPDEKVREFAQKKLKQLTM